MDYQLDAAILADPSITERLGSVFAAKDVDAALKTARRQTLQGMGFDLDGSAAAERERLAVDAALAPFLVTDEGAVGDPRARGSDLAAALAADAVTPRQLLQRGYDPEDIDVALKFARRQTLQGMGFDLDGSAAAERERLAVDAALAPFLVTDEGAVGDPRALGHDLGAALAADAVTPGQLLQRGYDPEDVAEAVGRAAAANPRFSGGDPSTVEPMSPERAAAWRAELGRRDTLQAMEAAGFGDGEGNYYVEDAQDAGVVSAQDLAGLGLTPADVSITQLPGGPLPEDVSDLDAYIVPWGPTDMPDDGGPRYDLTAARENGVTVAALRAYGFEDRDIAEAEASLPLTGARFDAALESALADADRRNAAAGEALDTALGEAGFTRALLGPGMGGASASQRRIWRPLYAEANRAQALYDTLAWASENPGEIEGRIEGRETEIAFLGAQRENLEAELAELTANDGPLSPLYRSQRAGEAETIQRRIAGIAAQLEDLELFNLYDAGQLGQLHEILSGHAARGGASASQRRIWRPQGVEANRAQALYDTLAWASENPGEIEGRIEGRETEIAFLGAQRENLEAELAELTANNGPLSPLYRSQRAGEAETIQRRIAGIAAHIEDLELFNLDDAGQLGQLHEILSGHADRGGAAWTDLGSPEPESWRPQGVEANRAQALYDTLAWASENPGEIEGRIEGRETEIAFLGAQRENLEAELAELTANDGPLSPLYRSQRAGEAETIQRRIAGIAAHIEDLELFNLDDAGQLGQLHEILSGHADRGGAAWTDLGSPEPESWRPQGVDLWTPPETLKTKQDIMSAVNTAAWVVNAAAVPGIAAMVVRGLARLGFRQALGAVVRRVAAPVRRYAEPRLTADAADQMFRTQALTGYASDARFFRGPDGRLLYRRNPAPEFAAGADEWAVALPDEGAAAALPDEASGAIPPGRSLTDNALTEWAKRWGRPPEGPPPGRPPGHPGAIDDVLGGGDDGPSGGMGDLSQAKSGATGHWRNLDNKPPRSRFPVENPSAVADASIPRTVVGPGRGGGSQGSSSPQALMLLRSALEGAPEVTTEISAALASLPTPELAAALAEIASGAAGVATMNPPAPPTSAPDIPQTARQARIAGAPNPVLERLLWEEEEAKDQEYNRLVEDYIAQYGRPLTGIEAREVRERAESNVKTGVAGGQVVNISPVYAPVSEAQKAGGVPNPAQFAAPAQGEEVTQAQGKEAWQPEGLRMAEAQGEEVWQPEGLRMAEARAQEPTPTPTPAPTPTPPPDVCADPGF